MCGIPARNSHIDSPPMGVTAWPASKYLDGPPSQKTLAFKPEIVPHDVLHHNFKSKISYLKLEQIAVSILTNWCYPLARRICPPMCITSCSGRINRMPFPVAESNIMRSRSGALTLSTPPTTGKPTSLARRRGHVWPGSTAKNACGTTGSPNMSES